MTKDVFETSSRRLHKDECLTKVAKVFVVVDDSQSVKNKRIDQISLGEQEPVSSSCNRTSNLEKFWKDKSSEDS